MLLANRVTEARWAEPEVGEVITLSAACKQADRQVDDMPLSTFHPNTCQSELKGWGHQCGPPGDVVLLI